MGKGKQRTINKIENVNMDIDYDKLAVAIAKAIQKLEDDEEESDQQLSESNWKLFWKNIWDIIINKIDRPFFSDILVILIQTIFNVFALACVFLMVLHCCYIGRRIWGFLQYPLLDNLLFLSERIFLVLIFGFVALIMRGSANDISREGDKNYIVSVFSCLVSLVALVVSFVALFKGM